jgi:hypothetical protein
MYGAHQQHTMRVPVDTTYRYGGKLNMALAFRILTSGVGGATRRSACLRSAVRFPNSGGGGTAKAPFAGNRIIPPA